MDSKDFLLRTLELASWKCHNSYNKNVVTSVKRDINRLFVEHEKSNLSPFHSAAFVVFNIDLAMQHASFDNTYSGNIIADARRIFISKSSHFFSENLNLLFKRDLHGNTPLHICIAYKNEELTNSILKLLNNEQLIFLISSRSSKNSGFESPLERILGSKWNYLIKYLNHRFTDKDFSNLMQKLNCSHFYPDDSNFSKEPIITVAIKNIDKVSTPDYIKFVTQMVANSDFNHPNKLNFLLNEDKSDSKFFHHLVKNIKNDNITKIFLNNLRLPSDYLQSIFQCKDKDGRTPFHIALINKNFNIAFNILSRADSKLLFLRDNFNRTAHDEIMDLLGASQYKNTTVNNEDYLVRILNILDKLQDSQIYSDKFADKKTSNDSSTHHIRNFLIEKKNSFSFLSISIY
jgi:ankyrin repeat protein